MVCSCPRTATLLAAALSIGFADAIVLKQTVAENIGISYARALPQEKRIAILFRGEAFRYGYLDENRTEHRLACATEGIKVQLNCTQSVIERIIQPLEQNGNRVEVFFTTTLPAGWTRLPAFLEVDDDVTPGLRECRLDTLVINALRAHSNRVVKSRALSTLTQAGTMMELMISFNNEYGGVHGVQTRFDYIFILRNDMYWFKAIDQIPVEFNNVNVLSRCAPGMKADVGGALCVHDTFWMMPTSLYGAFSSSVGQPGCFDPALGFLANGHSCQKLIRDAVAKVGHPGAFGWLEPGQRNLRERSDINGWPDAVVKDPVADLIDPLASTT